MGKRFEREMRKRGNEEIPVGEDAREKQPRTMESGISFLHSLLLC